MGRAVFVAMATLLLASNAVAADLRTADGEVSLAFDTSTACVRLPKNARDPVRCEGLDVATVDARLESATPDSIVLVAIVRQSDWQYTLIISKSVGTTNDLSQAPRRR